MNNKNKGNYTYKMIHLVLIIVVFMIIITGSTFAYYAVGAGNSVIRGNAGKVDLSLTVTKVLPNTNTTDDILIANFAELAGNLNNSCVDGEYALCQLYRINLANSTTGVNTNVKGSLSFNNSTVPNLSWVYLGNSYSSSTIYTSSMLGNTFNTANSTFTSFVDNYLLESGNNKDFYILVWVNESEEEQNDMGSYSGVVRFEDATGQGVTASFAD